MPYRSPYLGTDEYKQIRRRMKKRGKLKGLNREQRQRKITRRMDRMIANTDKLPPNAYMAKGGIVLCGASNPATQKRTPKK